MSFVIVGGSERFVGKAKYYKKTHKNISEKEAVIKSGADRLLTKTVRKKVLNGIIAMSTAGTDAYLMPSPDFTITGGAEEAEYSYAQQAADLEEGSAEDDYHEIQRPISYGIFA